MSDVEIIARLGHTCGLPWARCQATANRTDARGGPLAQCDKPSGHSGRHWFYAAVFTRTITHRDLPPTLAEWQAEWAREHPGEPGPVASHEGGRVMWCVSNGVVHIETASGLVVAMRGVADVSWNPIAGYGIGTVSAADVIELGRLMKAADGGTDD